MGIWLSKKPPAHSAHVFHTVSLLNLQEAARSMDPYPQTSEQPVGINYHIAHPCSVSACPCSWRYRITRVDSCFHPTVLPLVDHIQLEGATEDCEIGLTTEQYMYYYHERPDVSWFRNHPTRRQEEESKGTDDPERHTSS